MGGNPFTFHVIGDSFLTFLGAVHGSASEIESKIFLKDFKTRLLNISTLHPASIMFFVFCVYSTVYCIVPQDQQ
jgi:hypothetical protein